jgi:hypothetical protein
MNMDRTSVIYIMGYGRSGSTLLDILLNNHPEMVSVGALSNLFDWILHRRICACGNILCDCEFWKHIVKNYDFDLVRELRKTQLLVEDHKHFMPLIKNQLPVQLATRYSQLMTKLYLDLANQSGNHFIVDSSKSAREVRGRAYALASLTTLDIKLIHLVRDGRAVMWSALRGPGSPERAGTHSNLLRIARAGIGWAQTNKICMNMSQWLGGKSVLLVRYEDLISNPAREMTRIGNYINLPMDSIIQKIRESSSFVVGHNLGGNRLRFNEKITITPDLSWHSSLPKIYSIAFWCFARDVARKFDYHFD